MPSFYPRQPAGLPLTPPEYPHYGQYGMNGAGAIGTGFRPLKGVFDYQNEQFHQATFYGQQQQQDHIQQQIHQQNAAAYQHHRLSQPFLGQSIAANKFFPIEPPVSLPSMKQMQVDNTFDHQQQQQQQQQQAEERRSAPAKAEEKPVGGVSAYLDYEISDMADFVSSVASGIMLNGTSSQTSPSQTFRKFVFQILTSTRLPSSTILLGMEYLSNRINMLGGPNPAKYNEIYKTLTVALLLASKFLDDNTFQNRSWAEVTGIPVLELNKMEADWLAAISWRLHRKPSEAKSFEAWRATWKTWLAMKEKSKNLPQALAPIDTTASQRHSIASYSPMSGVFPQRQDNRVAAAMPTPIHTPSYNQENTTMWWGMSGGERSPPSAPETGPATPEWNIGMNWAQYGQRMQHDYNRPPLSQVSSNLHQYMNQTHQHQHQHHVWGQCGCQGCLSHNTYQLGHNFIYNYGQPVVA